MSKEAATKGLSKTRWILLTILNWFFTELIAVYLTLNVLHIENLWVYVLAWPLSGYLGFLLTEKMLQMQPDMKK